MGQVSHGNDQQGTRAVDSPGIVGLHKRGRGRNMQASML